MLPEQQEVLKITPPPESLVITHNKDHGIYTCPEEGCSFSTSSPSLLGLHKAKTHNIKTGPRKGVVHQYFCPHPGCYFSSELGRFFKNLDMLRTHYMQVHMEKKFKCSKCGKSFGLERDCLRHEKECGQSFACPVCEKVYNNKNALRMHCLAKRHEMPPEVCPKPRVAVDKTVNKKKKEKPQRNKQHPVPILPKFSSEDKISLVVPSGATNLRLPPTSQKTQQNSSPQSPAPIAVILQKTKNNDDTNGNIVLPQSHGNSKTQCLPVTIIHTSTNQKLLCDNVAQTISYLPSKAKTKRHAPTQTRLSILEMAMKSSEIPITKTSRATQKSLSGPSRKRKCHNKKDAGTGTKIYKTAPKLTVATLTNPQRIAQNIGSQTISSILYQNQQRSMAVNTSDVYFKTSMSTQTFAEEPLFRLDLDHQNNQNNLNLSNVTYQSQQNGHPPVSIEPSGSNTQALNCLLTQMPTCELNNSETQTCLTQSFNSTTQTPQFLALDSSTQTLNVHLDNSSSNLLDELFPESSGVNVNTQTFGCFSSDMMTQTLEQLASGESHTTGTNTFADGDGVFLMRNDTTTQTFEDMVDSITQTFGSGIADGATQTSLRADIMTQTFDSIGIDLMDGVVTTPSVGFEAQPITSSQPGHPELYENHCQTEINSTFHQGTGAVLQNTIVEITPTTKTHQMFSEEILNLMTENSISVQGDKDYKGLAAQTQTSQSVSTTCDSIQASNDNVLLLDNLESVLPTSVSEVREMALQTEDIDLWELSAQSDTDYPRTNPDDCSALYGNSEENNTMSNRASVNPVTDSMTQTLSIPDDDDMTLEALLSDMATQTFDEDDISFDSLLQSSNGLSSADLATQTPQIVTDYSCQTPVLLGSENEANVKHLTTIENGENIWDIGTQTFDDVREIALQTEGRMIGANENRGLINDVVDIGTETAFDMDGFRVVGIQNFENELWEMGTQTCIDNVLEMGTQTGVNNAWETGTQTGLDDAWEMGTQTFGDNVWEMGTQTGLDDAWKMGTQTFGDNVWEMGTQTGGDNLWEMGTQTRGNNAWEMGTQTGGDNLWEMGTQTGGDNAWEMGTQTGEDNAWEMGTQTMDNLLTDTMTQTGDDLIDFLLTGDAMWVASKK